ncbi:urease accessory protein UreF [Acaryochloris sp. IP29b_bin.148]|uniref:urease accessory protein UreF n=1 Tax=Acaryochloris sp. IP29b_bin.148 TaxID=2969218 RepID=UPI0026299DB5|nr:urease accessory protein UreF [Acaryochloris sp. IP29b_bin.148]
MDITQRLLQLTSPALPVGAYSYSEGLEWLVDQGTINNESHLRAWLLQELAYGSIRMETAVMVRGYRANADVQTLLHWNAWFSAARETEELRLQSLQMGRSLLRLSKALHDSEQTSPELIEVWEQLQIAGCNFAIAFGLTANLWQIPLEPATLGYLHSWATNLISAGIKLIPLGQTTGQQLLFQLQPHIEDATQSILLLKDEDLCSCGWGLALASMAHETQYSRLFRS